MTGKDRYLRHNGYDLTTALQKDPNADYMELQSIDAKDLLPLHDQIFPDALGPRLKTVFDKIRLKRNKVIHSVSNEVHEEESILKEIIKISHLLYEKNWMSLRIQYLEKLYASDTTVFALNALEELEVCKSFFSIGDFKVFSGYLPKDLVILCSECRNDSDGLLDTHTSIRLTPLTYKCLICKKVGKVSKRKCTTCKTQSLSIDDQEICLHCL